MDKPFDAPVEQLAHDLAIISTLKFAIDRDKPYSIPEYYNEYIGEYREFKNYIENEMTKPD